MKIFKIFSGFVTLVAILGLIATGCAKEPTKLVVFVAGSLNLPFAALAEGFEKEHPRVRIEQESGGSVLLTRAITELGRPCDVLAVADYRLIDELMVPQHADWQVLFARNEMVVAYTGTSKYGHEINAENWYRILLRPDVQYAHSDPNQDPSGYRTLLCWKLASIEYADRFDGDLYKALNEGCDPRNIRSDANKILPLLEAVGGVDYLFTYRSVAEQHHLQYVRLPDRIALGNPDMGAYYVRAEAAVTDKKGRRTKWSGAPIAFGLTIPKNSRSPKAALEFIKFILSEKGAEIFKAHYQPLISPPRGKGNVPAELLDVTQPMEQQ